MMNTRSIVPRLALAALGVVVLAGSPPAQDMLRSHAGAAPGESLGIVASAGDVDGDGVPDLALGSPRAAGAGPDAGRVAVTSGADGALLWSVDGSTPGELFGSAIASVRDADGDGRPDLLVGGPGAAGSGLAGTARLLSGADGTTIRAWHGAEAGSQFGFSVSGAVIGWSEDDSGVVIGAPCEDAAGIDSGAVHIFAGDDGQEIHAVAGGQPGDRYGHSVCGDLDDLLKSEDDAGVVIGATQSGNGGAGYVEVLAPGDLSVAFRVSGDADGDRFGVSAVLAGDVDGDGVVDLLAGSLPLGPDGLPARAGYARLISGADGATLLGWTGAAVDSRFAWRVAALGDADGDGTLDLGVSEPGSDGFATDSGCLHVLSGVDGTAIHRIHGPQTGSAFASSVTWAGDLDADGLADFAVGAPLAAGGAGEAYVVSMGHWQSLGEGLPGVEGVPRLTGQSGTAGGEVRLTLTGARAQTSAQLVIGTATWLDTEHGVVSPLPETVVEGCVTGSDGRLELLFTWPPEMSAGTKVYYQYLVSDPDAPDGQARSNTIAGLVP